MKRSVTSVVLTYNHARFIEQAVRSVQSQELAGWHHGIVVIDDASTDGTSDIVRRLAAEDERIRAVVLPSNECSNRAFVAELEDCGSRYFSLLDGDDYWTSKDKLSMQIDYLEATPPAVVCFHDALVVDEHGNRVALHRWPGPPVTGLADILLGNYILTCSAVARVEAFGALPAWYVTAPLGDWPLWVLAARRGGLHHLRKTLAVRRILNSGVWCGSSREQQLKWYIALYPRLAEAIDEPAARALVERRLWHRSYELAAELEQLGRSEDAAAQLQKCLQWRPAGALESYFSRGGISPAHALALLRRRWLMNRFRRLATICDRIGWRAGERLPTFMTEVPLWSDSD